MNAKRTTGRRTKAEAELTREALLDAAEQVFLEKGVGKSSLEEIARHVGMTRGALYWHFRNKQYLFEAMLARIELPLEELSDTFCRQHPNNPLATLEELCLHSALSLANDPQRQRVYSILFHRFESENARGTGAEPILKIQRRTQNLFETLFTQAQAANQLRPDLTPYNTAIALRAYLLGIYSSWLSNPECFSLAEEAATMISIFFNGIRRNNERMSN